MKKKLTGIIILTLIFLIIVAAIGGVFLRKHLQKMADLQYEQADSLFKTEAYADALVTWEIFLDRYPRDQRRPEAIYNAAVCLDKLNRKEEARTYWEEVSREYQLSTYYPAALCQLVTLQMVDGLYGEAATGYREIIRNYPRSWIIPEALVGLGMAYHYTGELSEAKAAYEKLLEEHPDSNSILLAKRNLGKINLQLLLSPAPSENSIFYTVKRGDSLEKIARKFHTTVPLLMKVNQLTSTMIRIGKRLKVIRGEFGIMVDVSEHTLTLRLDEHFIKEYPVGTGRHESTPLGEFKVVNKQIEPVWYSDEGILPYGHPDNILGTRWIGINKPGYGIHGTTKPETVGKSSSAGCIRMYNEDVEELFELVTVGTPVIIQE